MPDLKILEDQFSSDEEFEDDDSESSTDVDAKLEEEEVFDVDFLKCYSALKRKDHKIYDENVKFFTDDESSSDEANDGDDSKKKQSNPKKHSKAPKMNLLDHQLHYRDEELEDPSSKPKVDLNKAVSKSFYEKELDEIKKSIEKVSENINSDSEDDLFVAKSDPSSAKSRKVISSILDKIDGEDDEDLRRFWVEGNTLSEEDKFLRDYILNKRYLPPKQDKDEAHFSKNIDELSDIEDETTDDKETKKNEKPLRHADDRDVDKIARIPRNATKTIRDMKEKQEKKEKRLKNLEKVKRKKRTLKDADCEDIVGDMATRFHYRNTEANDYGLSAEELLMATDEELENWVKLKEAISYKSPDEEQAMKAKYEARRTDMELKKKIFKSIYGEPGADSTDTKAPQLKAGNKRKRVKDVDNESQDAQVQELSTEKAEESNNKRKKKKHKRGLNHKKFAKTGVAPDRLLAYGLSKTKLRKSKLL